MGTVTQDGRLLVVKTILGENVLLASQLSVGEQISRPFSIQLDLLAELTEVPKVIPDKLLGKGMSVDVKLRDDSVRMFHGICMRFVKSGADERFAHYSVELIPWLGLLALRYDCRTYQKKTVMEIIKDVFDRLEKNFAELVNYRDATQGEYKPIDCCIQYRESDLDFVSRLMEQDGIHYFFEHSGDKHTLVLADDPSANQPCPNQSTFRYGPEAGLGDREDIVTSWQERMAMTTGRYSYRDHHFQMSNKTLEISASAKVKLGGNDKLEIYDFPGEYAQRFDGIGKGGAEADKELQNVERQGKAFAETRIQEQEMSLQQMSGSSICRSLSPGFRFNLMGKDDSKIVVSGTNGEYLATSVRHVILQTPDYFSGSETDQSYHNTFDCMPHQIPFRPRRVTARPVIQGMQSAVVVGPKGEEIFTDKYGRVKVQFHWDREGKKDDNSSCWVRVSQSMAGTKWGTHFWPRIGHEVIVAFMEGDPDKPIIVCSVYNYDNNPPYDLPENQMWSGIKSRSTKDGTTKHSNELLFKDNKGKEEIYFHAEKNFNRVVEKDETIKVFNNRYVDIGFGDDGDAKAEEGSEHIKVWNSRTHFVGCGMAEAKDGGNEMISVFNNQSVYVGDVGAEDGSQHIKIYSSQYVTVGNSERPEGSQITRIWKDQDTTIQTGDRNVKIDMGNDNLTVELGNQKTAISLGKSETEAMQAIELKVGQSSIKIDQMGVTIKGMTIKVEGSIMTEVKGMMTAVKADAVLTLKGGVAMIN